MSYTPTSADPVTSKAIVLLSGGLDSTVALAETLQRAAVPLALTFHYGQRAWEREREATRRLAQHFGACHRVVELPWLAELLPPALTPRKLLMEPEAAVTAENLFETRRVWVPNRNGVFLNIAAAFAEAHGAEAVVFGANADEAVGFPDNTTAYRDALTAALAFSTLRGVRVETPVGHLTKAEILQRGLALGVPLERIWSCYEGETLQCGVCPSCLLLKKALATLETPLAVSFRG